MHVFYKKYIQKNKSELSKDHLNHYLEDNKELKERLIVLKSELTESGFATHITDKYLCMFSASEFFNIKRKLSRINLLIVFLTTARL